MIKSWSVSNFKSIRKETELDFSPLTIFAGANSSGKSSFLQTILLVAQSCLASKIESRPVVLNGTLVRLGQFNDLRTADSEAGQIVIGWKVYRYKLEQPFVSCRIAFDAGASDEDKEITQVWPQLASLNLELSEPPPKTRGRSVSDPFYLNISRAEGASLKDKQKWIDAASESGDDEFRDGLQYNVEIDIDLQDFLRSSPEKMGGREFGDLISAEMELVGCRLGHFLPVSLYFGSDGVVDYAQAIWDTIAHHISPWSPVVRDGQGTWAI